MSLLLALPILPLAAAVWLAASTRAGPLSGWVVALIAAFPVTIAALAPSAQIELPHLLLKASSALILDDTARAALLLFGGLWLAAGLLMTRQESGRGRGGIALLVALSGALTLALADGGPLVYAGMLATGYGLYAIMAGEPGTDWRRAARVMIVLLVVSDLLVFELLLSATASPAGDFRPGLLLLLLAALVLRGGVPPAHAWLPPALAAVGSSTAILLAAVPTGAALFGALKLLPGGAREIGTACALLGTAGAAWATVAGLAQVSARATLGYALAATAALLLLALPAGAGPGVRTAWLGVALLACTAALPLVALQRSGPARDVAAALVLVLHGLAAGHTAVHAAGALPRWGGWLAPLAAVAATMLLTLAMWRTAVVPADGPVDSTQLVFLPVLLSACALGLSWRVGLPAFDSLWVAPVAVTLGLVVFRALPERSRPRVAPGDLLVPVEAAVGLALKWLRRLCSRTLPGLRDRLTGSVRRSWDGASWSHRIQRVDLRLRAWPVTSLMMLLVALSAAWLLVE